MFTPPLLVLQVILKSNLFRNVCYIAINNAGISKLVYVNKDLLLRHLLSYWGRVGDFSVPNVDCWLGNISKMFSDPCKDISI